MKHHFSTQSQNTLMHLSSFDKFYNSEEMEMAVHEWLRIQKPDFYSDETCAKTGQMH
jgi:hypothetical protein